MLETVKEEDFQLLYSTIPTLRFAPFVTQNIEKTKGKHTHVNRNVEKGCWQAPGSALPPPKSLFASDPRKQTFACHWAGGSLPNYLRSTILVMQCARCCIFFSHISPAWEWSLTFSDYFLASIRAFVSVVRRPWMEWIKATPDHNVGDPPFKAKKKSHAESQRSWPASQSSNLPGWSGSCFILLWKADCQRYDSEWLLFIPSRAVLSNKRKPRHKRQRPACSHLPKQPSMYC